MLLNLLINNIPISLEGLLNCICTHASIKVNVFIQKNIYPIYIYAQKSREKCLSPDKCPFLLTFFFGFCLAFP